MNQCRKRKNNQLQADHLEVINRDAVKFWPVACVCFGDGHTEAMQGETGRVPGRIKEGQRARKAKRGGWSGKTMGC